MELFRKANLTSTIVRVAKYTISFYKSFFDDLYESYRNFDFVYNIQFEPVLSSDLEKKTVNPPKYPNARDITPEFYNGFGHDLL